MKWIKRIFNKSPLTPKVEIKERIDVLGTRWYYLYYNGQCQKAYTVYKEVEDDYVLALQNIEKGLPKERFITT